MFSVSVENSLPFVNTTEPSLCSCLSINSLRIVEPVDDLRTSLLRQLDLCHSRQFYGRRRDGLMVSVLDSGASGPGSGPGRGHCVVFLGKTRYSHGASPHPGV